jgi:hypothetical protein
MTGEFIYGYEAFARAAQAAATCHARAAYAQAAGAAPHPWFAADRSANRPRHSRYSAGPSSERQTSDTADTPHVFGSATLPKSVEDAYTALYLRPGAPQPVVKAVYRTLAQLHHPDAGGDPEAMTRINAAYAAIQRSSH